MASSSLTGSVNRRAVVRTKCHCGDDFGMWTSWTPRNPGRRFVGCRNFKDKTKDCKYFAWIDPPLPNNWYRGQMMVGHNLGIGGNMEVEAVVDGNAGNMENDDGVPLGTCKIALVVVLVVVVLVFGKW